MTFRTRKAAGQSRPPGAQTPGGLACVSARRALFAAVAIAVFVVPLRAQVVRGTIKTQETAGIVPDARITAADSSDRTIAETRSDERGRFVLRLPSDAPFKLSVTKVGWLPSSSDLLKVGVNDTVDVDLTVPADPVALNTVEVTARKSANELALEDARRKGWKTYSPALVEKYRDSAGDFLDLLRGVGAGGGLILSSRDCIRSVRFNRCMTYILDGMPAGQSVFVSPRDVYFFSVLSATESASRWGDKAPWGAVVIYTRMYGDKKAP